METGNLLLVGRSGNGLTSIVKSITALKDRFPITVVEVQGVGDIKEDLHHNITEVLLNVRKQLLSWEQFGGTKAILFAMKYGIKCTQQEVNAVERVMHVFGENVYRRFGVLVFIYGDLFYNDDKDHNFMNWCRDQKGKILQLFKEVDFRCVLFDNITRDKEKQLGQVEALMQCVKRIEGCYRLQDFNAAEQQHKMLSKIETDCKKSNVSATPEDKTRAKPEGDSSATQENGTSAASENGTCLPQIHANPKKDDFKTTLGLLWSIFWHILAGTWYRTTQ